MYICMRTTLNLDDTLLTEAKMYAVETGRTLTAVIEDALREALGRRQSAERGAPVRLTTYSGGGLQPGIDLDDSAAVRDAMDGV
jgi:Arc/MetJ family transcription regulator